ncbi:rRNA large subunit methyltransferase [Paramagnetospirillum caucaseum]|uniref:Ribosomal RNA large subunit methyltransferase H n=1 Tax=Paramagnetospirillum caucaseum TaxID=1244869 RepID=M3AD21_9PROT|nr:23S rRNA (pseudouridine(1915)-N(3))-methyltransferase RlmH [Paramagnetospirillum caucaseum]EME70663.1 rRNA large subunit methyltransferase [Paramagnetospirillum caucaseum]
MRLIIAAVGKAKAGPEQELFRQYCRRLTPPPVLKEVEEKRPLAGPQLKAREAELLLAALPEGAVVVALDEKGRDMGSVEFAGKLRGWRDGGAQDVAFLIGGADGHGDAVRERAGLLLSFGRMTWPHMLVRALLAEQLWRAHSILAGHPYHRT